MRLFAGTEFDQPPKCDRCGKLEQECACFPEPPSSALPGKQTARIQLEKRKKGKSVTVIRGLDPTGVHLKEVLTMLKDSCGAGGTIQENVIEIQGDHLARIEMLLKAKGYKTKS